MHAYLPADGSGSHPMALHVGLPKPLAAGLCAHAPHPSPFVPRARPCLRAVLPSSARGLGCGTREVSFCPAHTSFHACSCVSCVTGPFFSTAARLGSFLPPFAHRAPSSAENSDVAYFPPLTPSSHPSPPSISTHLSPNSCRRIQAAGVSSHASGLAVALPAGINTGWLSAASCIGIALVGQVSALKLGL